MYIDITSIFSFVIGLWSVLCLCDFLLLFFILFTSLDSFCIPLVIEVLFNLASLLWVILKQTTLAQPIIAEPTQTQDMENQYLKVRLTTINKCVAGEATHIDDRPLRDLNFFSFSFLLLVFIFHFVIHSIFHYVDFNLSC